MEGSGWTTALAEANVATAGTSDSFLKAASVTRTRRAHQITASSLYALLTKSYQCYKDGLEQEEPVASFSDWCLKKVATVPQFHFWYLTLQLELLLLVFVRSLREANFELYLDSLSKMVPWLFGLDHTHYARWLPIHLRDMYRLQDFAPDVALHFKQGKFVVNKTSKPFSSIPIDQAHEQNNALVKGEGGAVGLTENPSALRQWMVSGPEMARVINEFEASIVTESTQNKQNGKHHEDTRSLQSLFYRDVTALTRTIEEMGNPFMEETEDLLVLDTKEIMSSDAVVRLRKVEEVGMAQYESFITERLVQRSKSLYDPIKRNDLGIFNFPSSKTVSKTTQQLSSAKNDCLLFSRLYISCQTREGNLDEFFQHENQSCPPSLSQDGKLRLPQKKSELAECLQSFTTPQVKIPEDVDAIIIDGSVVVNMVKPRTEKTFAEYSRQSFLPYIQSQLSHAKRLDVVWDEYVPNSLKATTRSKRGKGVRRRVQASSQLPRNWQQFLQNDENKQELFRFLAESVLSLHEGKQVITTKGREILCTLARSSTPNLTPCTHEEADTRMILHAADAVQEGHQKIVIRTVDTDVLVLAVTLADMLREQQVEVWVAMGTGSHLRYIAAHEISSSLGPEMSKSLPIFHAFTGCDTVSCFAGRGKKTAFTVWRNYPAVTDAFLQLASSPTHPVSEACMANLERFVILMYDRTSSKTKVDEARKQLFAQKGRAYDAIPPTRAALLQHTYRAAYQGGHCWGQAVSPSPELPSPGDWGWIFKDGEWQPFWTTLPEVTKSCRELIRCGCKAGCRGSCSCKKAALQCTALCSCTEQCNNR